MALGSVREATAEVNAKSQETREYLFQVRVLALLALTARLALVLGDSAIVLALKEP